MNLKFRFWHTLFEKYVGSEEWGLYGNGSPVLITDGGGIQADNRVTVEQWTGRVDCNDREIYVGDIVTLWISNHPFTSGKFEVKFHRGSYGLHAHIVDGLAGMFWPSGKQMTGWNAEEDEPIWTEDLITRWHDLSFGDNVMEVIGNIHENKELLK